MRVQPSLGPIKTSIGGGSSNIEQDHGTIKKK